MKKIFALGVSAFFAAFFLIPSVSFAFDDLPEDHHSYNAVLYLSDIGAVNGYEDGTFKPDKTINRAEFLKIVLESAYSNNVLSLAIEGEGCFKDVGDEWFAKYVCTAKDLGYVDGYSDGNFRPDQEINFVEASKIVSNVLGWPVDDQYVEAWFEKYVVSLENRNAIPSTVFNFNQNITRGEMAEIVYYGMTNNSNISFSYADLRALSEFPGKIERIISTPDMEGDYFMFDDELYFVQLGVSYHITGVENPRMLKQLTERYFIDDTNVYSISGFSGEADVIKGVDIDSFEVLYSDYSAFKNFWARDKDNVYFGVLDDLEIVDGVDIDHFTLLYCRTNVCGIDGEAYYFDQGYIDEGINRIKRIDLSLNLDEVSTWSRYVEDSYYPQYSYNDGYAFGDSENVYYFRSNKSIRRVDNADFDTFEVLVSDGVTVAGLDDLYKIDADYLAKDKDNVWIHLTSTDDLYLVEGADPEWVTVANVEGVGPKLYDGVHYFEFDELNEKFVIGGEYEGG